MASPSLSEISASESVLFSSSCRGRALETATATEKTFLSTKRFGSSNGKILRFPSGFLQLYSAANDPETANDPRPQMIPKLDRK